MSTMNCKNCNSNRRWSPLHHVHEFKCGSAYDGYRWLFTEACVDNARAMTPSKIDIFKAFQAWTAKILEVTKNAPLPGSIPIVFNYKAQPRPDDLIWQNFLDAFKPAPTIESEFVGPIHPPVHPPDPQEGMWAERY